MRFPDSRVALIPKMPVSRFLKFGFRGHLHATQGRFQGVRSTEPFGDGGVCVGGGGSGCRALPPLRLAQWLWAGHCICFRRLVTPFTPIRHAPPCSRWGTLSSISGALVAPADILKVNLQTGRYASPSAALTALHRVSLGEGAFALLQALAMTYARDLPACVAQIVLYTQLQRRIAGAPALCGALAGAVGAGLTTPVDALRTRRMAVDGDAPRRRPVFRDAFAGAMPRMAGSALSGCVFFGIYEASKPWVATLLLP